MAPAEIAEVIKRRRFFGYPLTRLAELRQPGQVRGLSLRLSTRPRQNRYFFKLRT
jgi:hypothetical protein